MGSLGAEGDLPIALCPGFLLFPKVLRTVLWILFLHWLHPSRMGRMLAPSSNRDFLLHWDKAMGEPLFQKRQKKKKTNQKKKKNPAKSAHFVLFQPLGLSAEYLNQPLNSQEIKTQAKPNEARHPIQTAISSSNNLHHLLSPPMSWDSADSLHASLVFHY